jgi:hypothetical protein
MMKNGMLMLRKDSYSNSQKISFKKRPGIGATAYNSTVPAANVALVAAAQSPRNDGSVFYIYTDSTLANTTCYKDATNKALPGTWAGNSSYAHDLVPLAHSSSGLYGTSEFAFTNYAEGALVDNTGAITEITDADYTAWTTKSNILPMDGYLFQADYVTNYIYNSDLNTPTSWTATGRILAGLHVGRIVRLCRIRNFLVAFKTGSLEFFQNTGNPTPGSPLSAKPEMARRYGAVATEYFTETADGIVWVGYTSSGKVGVFLLRSADLQIEEISDNYICQVLQESTAIGAPNAYSLPYGMLLSMDTIPIEDKELVSFGVNIGGGVVATMLYDTQVKAWYMWTQNNSGTEAEFPSNHILVVNVGSVLTVVGNKTGTKQLYPISYLYARDYTSYDYEVRWNSDSMDFGTTRRKFMSSLEVQYNLQAETNTGTLTLAYFDDEGISASTRSAITIAFAGNTRIVWRKLGSFRNRRFIFTYTGNQWISFTVVECDLTMAEDDID